MEHERVLQKGEYYACGVASVHNAALGVCKEGIVKGPGYGWLWAAAAGAAAKLGRGRRPNLLYNGLLKAEGMELY